MKNNLGIDVKGHVNIQDDLGNVLLDADNAIHPQNVSRVIARALAREDNYYIHRIAFGNGGTTIDTAYNIAYKTPNDGQPPDTRTWDSRLYYETYSEIIDDNINPISLIGTDPGSAGPNTGTRPGGGSDPSGDPATTPHVSGPGVRSNELGLTSEVVITCVLNPGEPLGQFNTDNQSPSEDPDSDFTFDEIGLYTTGAPAIDSNGSVDVEIGDRVATDDTTLTANTAYSFNITIDGVSSAVSFTTPATGGSGTGGEILYGDLCEAINTNDTEWSFTGLPSGFIATITDDTVTGQWPSIADTPPTYGFLRFVSNSTGSTSSISLANGASNNLWDALNDPAGATINVNQLSGLDAGVQNDPVNSNTERERLLTHIIFSPVLKSANRTLTVTYTLTISVARTPS